MKKFGIFGMVALAVIGYLIYNLVHPSKAKMSKFIAAKYGIDYSALISTDYSYLHSRYSAAERGSNTFSYAGSIYSTHSGLIVSGPLGAIMDDILT